MCIVHSAISLNRNYTFVLLFKGNRQCTQLIHLICIAVHLNQRKYSSLYWFLAQSYIEKLTNRSKFMSECQLFTSKSKYRIRLNFEIFDIDSDCLESTDKLSLTLLRESSNAIIGIKAILLETLLLLFAQMIWYPLHLTHSSYWG